MNKNTVLKISTTMSLNTHWKCRSGKKKVFKVHQNLSLFAMDQNITKFKQAQIYTYYWEISDNFKGTWTLKKVQHYVRCNISYKNSREEKAVIYHLVKADIVTMRLLTVAKKLALTLQTEFLTRTRICLGPDHSSTVQEFFMYLKKTNHTASYYIV